MRALRPGALAASGVLALIALDGCGSTRAGLHPGASTRADVIAVMGTPAMRWSLPDRGEQLSYPTGPAGYESFMVYLDAGGRLVRVDNVLREGIMDRIAAGMDEADVVQLIGPPVPAWTADFDARREHVLEWRYCNMFSELQRFDVLFDKDRATVRSTLSVAEQCGRNNCYCGH